MFNLDMLFGLDFWRNNFVFLYYDFKLINEWLVSIEIVREMGDVYLLVNLLRSGLVRNLGNIIVMKLYNWVFVGIKFLIEEYVRVVVEGVEDIGSLFLLGEMLVVGYVVDGGRGVLRGGGVVR